MSVADLGRFDMVAPASLDAACELLGERGARGERTLLLAGGTDLFVELAVAPAHAPTEPLPLVVDVSRLSELRGVEWDGTRVRIGAATTYLELERDPTIRFRVPLVERMSYDVGGPTIQARGTLGGNLATASPAADGVAAIAAYDPDIVVRSVRGERRIPFAELQTGYKKTARAADEIICAIELLPPAPGSPWCWRKVGTRLAQAISKVALAGVAEVAEGRVRRCGLALASVAPVTALLPKTRALVTSVPLADLTAAAVDAAVDADTSPIADIRSTREYRAHVARVLVRGFLGELGAPVT